ncbi:MAG: hypothetical protein HYW02_07170, partial [Deltaproteobacteria bacterium]|nr:hypothetical protein [Deltaproteobacteria bacterium]
MSINLARGITVGAGVIGGVGLLGFLSGCSNPYTPAGQEGYVYEKPRWFGKGGYKGTIKGPGNFGNSLLKLEVINIELRPTTYATEVMVRTLDKVLVPLPVQVKISVKPGTSREVIEGIGDNWYESYVKPSLASTIRDVAMDIPTLSLKDQSGEIASRIATKMNAFLKEKPFVLHEVMVGDIYFPKEVQENIDRQLALKQEVEKRFLEIALEKDVKARERGLKELEAG